jgi:hypothetical protein
MSKQRRYITLTTTILTATLVATLALLPLADQQTFANPLDSEVMIEFDNSTPSDGDIVEITGSITTSDTEHNPMTDHDAIDQINIDDGIGKIEQGVDGVDGTGNPVSDCGSVISYKELSMVDPVTDGMWTHNFDTTGLGGQTLVFRAHFANGGSGIATGMSECVELEITASDPIEVEKTWTHTDYNWEYCAGYVDDVDHECWEEITFETPLPFEIANINNPEHDVLADPLDQDNDGKYTVFAQVHSNNNEFSNTNPGAFFALTTIDVNVDVDGLRVWENYGDCINQEPADGPDAMDLKLLSPENKPTRAVKAAIANPDGMVTEITDDLYDTNAITFDGVDDSAHVDILQEIPSGSTVYVLIKFQDDLKDYDTENGFFDAMCDNNEMVSELVEVEDNVYEEEPPVQADAALRIANDLDSDTVLDNQDNCPLDENLDQADEDSDGIGNACDAFPDDTDNDGVVNDDDLCSETPLGTEVNMVGCPV